MRQMLNKKQWISILFVLIFITANSLTAQQIQNLDDEPRPTPTPDDDGGLSTKPRFEGGLPVENPVFVMPQDDDQIISPQAVVAAPTVFVWYEDELEFGQNGNPQQWVNILGNVSGPPVNRILLDYRLNGIGGFKELDLGADKRRLGAQGDFNIELDIDDLIDGVNTVSIRAENTLTGEKETTDYLFTYQADNAPDENLTIDWSAANDIHEVAQVVDGQWTINADGTIGPNNVVTGDPELFYDRTLAIGDKGWTDYEVTVPLTIHGIDSASGFLSPSFGPGVGMIFRWNGHYEEDNEQPRTGWHQVGALGWFRWSDENTAGLQMIGWSYPSADYPGGGNLIGIANEQIAPVMEQEYIMRMNVQTLANGDEQYRLKVWPSNQNEPDEWNMEGVVDDPDAFDSGSVVLVAHHVDVSFGDVTVKPLSAVRQTITFNNLNNGAIVPSPNQSDYEFGSDVQVTAVPDPGYEFVSWSGDLSGSENPATLNMIQDYTISATFQLAQPPISDDFNACLIDNRWTEVNPSSDPNATYQALGEQLEIFVPSGSSHDMYPTSNENAIRLMQDATDEDFTIVVKFDSVLNASDDTVLQGVIIEQDANNYVRFDFQSDGGNIRIFHVSVTGGTVNNPDQSIETIPGNAEYMRITRDGNSWTQEYSTDGVNYTEHGSGFTHPMTVNKAGVFGGNAGTNPAHTVLVDYFYNSASPGVGDLLSANSVETSASPSNGGAVNVLTNNFGCGDSVTIEAVPEDGWVFDGWEGDLSGQENPATLTFDVGTAVTAKFSLEGPVAGSFIIYLPITIR